MFGENHIVHAMIWNHLIETTLGCLEFQEIDPLRQVGQVTLHLFHGEFLEVKFHHFLYVG